MKRRHFLRLSAAGSASLFLAPAMLAGCASGEGEGEGKAAGDGLDEGLFFSISLAQWSLHKSFFGESLQKGWEYMMQVRQTDPDALFAGSIHPADFPRIAREQFGIGAVEYVSTFYPGVTGGDSEPIRRLRQTADQAGVDSVLIMVDMEGALGDPDATARMAAVENHRKWVESAVALGCHAIRVNAYSQGTREQQMELAADGLSRLADLAAQEGIDVIVENHGGFSSDGGWLAALIEMTGRDNCGTLPDFGNFTISETERYDPYRGVAELMPRARGVSAKSYDFDEAGGETTLDYRRLLTLVRDAGYTGHIGVEYEGSRLSEAEGILATRDLLLTIGTELSA